VFLFGYRPRSIVGSGYSRSISAGGSWRPYLLVFRVWLIRSLTPPKTELPATIANRRPKVEKYRGRLLVIIFSDELSLTTITSGNSVNVLPMSTGTIWAASGTTCTLTGVSTWSTEILIVVVPKVVTCPPP
jgi:hypothetical protein